MDPLQEGITGYFSYKRTIISDCFFFSFFLSFLNSLSPTYFLTLYLSPLWCQSKENLSFISIKDVSLYILPSHYRSKPFCCFTLTLLASSLHWNAVL